MIRRGQGKFWRIFLWGIFFLFFLLLVVVFFYARPIYAQARLAQYNMSQAVEAVYDGDFGRAETFSALAADNFQYLQERLDVYAQQKVFKLLTPDLLDSGLYFTQLATVVSETINRLSLLTTELKELWPQGADSFADLLSANKAAFLQTLQRSLPELNGLQASLELMLLELPEHSLPLAPTEMMFSLEEKLGQLNIILEKGTFAAELAPILLGYPQESNYLLIFQNNHEIRPSGGFIGSYGLLTMKDGQIAQLEADDIYHLDMPAIEKLTTIPPEPVSRYLETKKWYMRDANWSPDWPTSAQTLEWFYNEESSQDLAFQGVVAITPAVVADLLAILGPVQIDGEEFNEDNFHELLQYKTGREYWQNDIAFWDRKDLIGELMLEIRAKFLALSKDNWLDIIVSLDQSIKKKDILLYFNDPSAQAAVYQLEAGGELKNVDSNYLMVVDSNMAAFKTDAVMEKHISYEEYFEDGREVAEINIDYIHHGDFDWRTTRYRSYTRIYVPLGSELIDISGNTDEYVDLYQELNKQVYGVFISIEPGEQGSLSFKYALPEFPEAGIYLQKQPGALIKSLKVKATDYSYQGDFITDLRIQ